MLGYETRGSFLSQATCAKRYSCDPACSVWRLGHEGLAGVNRIECAFSFALSGSFAAWIERIRSVNDVSGGCSPELTPHVTLLHLGVQKVSELLDVPQQAIVLPDIELRFTEVKTFPMSNGMANIHARLTGTEALRHMQETLITNLSPYLNIEQFSSFRGKRFTPHVTILSASRNVSEIEEVVVRCPPPKQSFRLRDLHLIGDLATAHGI